MYSSYTTWILDINIFQTLMVFPGLYDVMKHLPRKENFLTILALLLRVGAFLNESELKLSGGLWVEARLEATQSFGLIDLQMQPGVKRLFLFFYLSIINTNAEYDDNNCGGNHCQLELLFKCTLISIDLFCALGWKSIVGLQTFVRKKWRSKERLDAPSICKCNVNLVWM